MTNLEQIAGVTLLCLIAITYVAAMRGETTLISLKYMMGAILSAVLLLLLIVSNQGLV